VRVTEQEVVVRLCATIRCIVHASFALSMTDPIDKDEVRMGSESAEIEETFGSDLLVTFEGDFAQGLSGVTVKTVELLEELHSVDFGEIELNWGQDDYEDPKDGVAASEGE
jgi:hypothetical protein